MTGRIFDIQRFSIHDGPGIRTTVFFQGCPLRCRWCHNPESVEAKPALFYTERLCLGCRACEAACPEGVHLFDETGHQLRREQCRLCGACAEACLPGALELAGREATVEEVLEVVRRDKIFYETSGGGITLSGGEPLAQPEFAAALLEQSRAEGLHTTVDTSGYAAPEALRRLLPFTDLWLFDVKHLDPEQHRLATGVRNERILESLRALDAAGAAVMLRVPLVPGFNDTPANLDALESLIHSLTCVQELRLLPYHRFQEDKYHRLGRAYPGTDLVPPEDAAVEAIRDRLAANTAITVGIGG